MHPVVWFGVVGAQFNKDHMGLKFQCGQVFGFFNVGQIAAAHECAGTYPEVTYLKFVAQQILQLSGVAETVAAFNAHTIGNAVAHTGYAYGFGVVAGLNDAPRWLAGTRSEERRVGKECRYRWWRDQ